jgi:hypothetical protein
MSMLPKGEPGYPVTNAFVRKPAAASERICSSIMRISAWFPLRNATGVSVAWRTSRVRFGEAGAVFPCAVIRLSPDCLAARNRPG